MPAGKTYIKIASQTLSSASASVTFSNLPQNYTDLIVVIGNYGSSVSGSYSVNAVLNNNTSSLYSYTILNGTGSAAQSYRGTNVVRMALGFWDAVPTTNIGNVLVHFQNYSNSSTNKTAISRYNSASGEVGSYVCLWRNTDPITSISFRNGNANSDTGNILANTTFTIYGIECAKNPYATGGDKVYTTGTHWVHEFYNSGLFVPRQNLNMEYLVVAGGGGGGGRNVGGGGGAGGYRTNIGGATINCSASNALTITVGAGGAGGYSVTTGNKGLNGSNSSYSGTGVTTLTASGGGGGSNGVPPNAGGSLLDGNSGGSGGGGGGVDSAPAGSGGAGNAGSYSPVEGYAGGNGSIGANGGGGGGSSAAGSNATTGSGANGGAGTSNSITGSAVTYAGGGGGGGNTAGGTGGSGGGGRGGFGGSPGNPVPSSGTAQTSGTANTGGGGGGSAGYETLVAGGNGGSGIVIVRYPI